LLVSAVEQIEEHVRSGRFVVASPQLAETDVIN
jgi:hypothetical protein